MELKRAKEVLTECYGKDFDFCLTSGKVSLTGRFSSDELEAIATWMRRPGGSGGGMKQNTEVPMDETGFLIECNGRIGDKVVGGISWLCVEDVFAGFGRKRFSYTNDASQALRFARRVDAQAILDMHLGRQQPDWYTSRYSVTEHIWHCGVVKS